MNNVNSSSLAHQITHSFFPHLRLHYQAGILSAAYLLALLFFPEPDWYVYGTQFFNVHILLFGGATAYNSYWDKDEGPVGGLRHPPPMEGWMRWAALGLMGVGGLLATYIGLLYASIYFFSAFLFWGYSSPLLRWKGRPLGSVVVIALSTGVNSFLLGSLAAGAGMLNWRDLVTALGVGSMLVSLYPPSQIYQREEDKERNDYTFAVRYGLKGVKIFFAAAYALGSLVLAFSLGSVNIWIAVIFLGITSSVGSWIYYRLDQLKGIAQEYYGVMRIKYATSIAFNLFIIISWVFIYYFRL